MKNTNQVFLTDLILLRDLFIAPGKALLVYDPNFRLNDINAADIYLTPLRPTDPDTVYADLSRSDCSIFIGTGSSPCVNLLFINNPDGTIRWIYDPADTRPAFLALYNGSGLKAGLYRTVTRLAWSFGQKNRLASGLLILQQNLLEQVKRNCGITAGESVSFFTGTRGLTRKVVMEIHRGNTVTDFIKIPVAAMSTETIDNENQMLNSLSRYDFTTLSLPKVSPKVNGHARLSNIRPEIVIPADRINAIHLRAASELYAVSHQQLRIADTVTWETISDHMTWLKRELTLQNGLEKSKVNRVVHLLRKLYNSIPTEERISSSVAHGDFTPWNMYCDEQRLFVYDWEMARSGVPMLFDLFHFTFQNTILRDRKNYTAVKSNINDWQQTEMCRRMIAKYTISTELHFRLYLLFTASYYLRQYICEKELLVQSNWMLAAWTEALEELTITADLGSQEK